MVKRSDRQLEKDKVIKQLSEYGLGRDSLESMKTDKLRRTLHAIRREMKSINKNVKIVIVATNNDYESDCSYCDTDDSECEYCDSEYCDTDNEDTEISIDSEDTEISIDSIDTNVSTPDLEESE